MGNQRAISHFLKCVQNRKQGETSHSPSCAQIKKQWAMSHFPKRIRNRKGAIAMSQLCPGGAPMGSEPFPMCLKNGKPWLMSHVPVASKVEKDG
eukprot:jgi/Botrbrau1/5148/Bobra.0172s0020.1